MKEVSAGKYVAAGTVPVNGSFGRNAVVGHLTLGGSSRDVQAGDRLVVDTQPPLVKATLPKAGTKVATNRPYISAELDDQSQTGVDKESVRLFVNDKEVTSEAAVTSGNVVYRGELAAGEVVVKLTVADQAGNVGSAQWSFTVGASASAELPAPPVIVLPKEDIKVSGALAVSGTAEKGATVRVRVTYSGTALVIFSQDGEVGTQEVKAGADGAWKTKEFALPRPSGLKDIIYTITATATDAKGLTSEPATLTLQRG